PLLPVSNYVLEFEVEVLTTGSLVRVLLGEWGSEGAIDLNAEEGDGMVRCRLVFHRPGGGYWNGQRKYPLKQPLPFKLVVVEGRCQLFFGNAPTLEVRGWPADLHVKILSSDQASATIHRCSFRPVR